MAKPNVGDVVGVNYRDVFDYTLKVEVTKISGSACVGRVKAIRGNDFGGGKDLGNVKPDADILDKMLDKEIEFDISQVRIWSW